MALVGGSRIRAPSSVRSRAGGRRILGVVPCGLQGHGISSLGPHRLYLLGGGRAIGLDTALRQGGEERLVELPVLLDHAEIRWGALVPACRGGVGDDPVQLHLRLANERNETARSVVRRGVEAAMEAVRESIGLAGAEWAFFTMAGILPVSGAELIGCLARGRIEDGMLLLEHSPVLGEDASLSDHLDALEEGPVHRSELALDLFEGLAEAGTGPSGPLSEAYRQRPLLGVTRVLLAGHFVLGGTRSSGLELHLPDPMARVLDARLPRTEPLWVPRRLPVPAPVPVLRREARNPDPLEGRCGVCGDRLVEPLRDCAICESRLHQECWAWVEGCVTYACAGRGRNLRPYLRTRPDRRSP